MLRAKNYKLKIDLVALGEKALTDYRNALDEITEPSQFILQSHLYIEQLLGRIITALLPRGKEVLDSTQWSFHNKLLIVHSLDILPPGIFEAVGEFNSLRNRLAHRFRYEISLEDIRKIAKNVPHIQERVLVSAKQNPLVALELLSLSLLGAVGGVAVAFENAEPPK